MSKKFSEFAAGSALAGTEKFPGLDGTTNKTWSATQIATFVNTSPALTGSPTAPTPSSADNSTKIATTAYVTGEIATAVTGVLKYKGDQDCSANPNYPTATKGDAYLVTVAGKIGGGSGTPVDVGDVFYARADNAGGTQAAVGTSWSVLEHNLAGALLSANNLSDVGNPATARTNLGLGSMSLLSVFAIPTGRWTFMEPILLGAGATGTAIADLMRGYPVRVRAAVTITDLQVRITTAAASGNFQFAIYASNPTTLAPTGAPLYSSASISTAATGNVGASSVATAIAAGSVIWIFINCDANANTNNFTTRVCSPSGTSYKQIMGTSAAFDVTSDTQNAQGASKSQTFNTWPTLTGNLATDGFTDVEASTIPAVAIKV